MSTTRGATRRTILVLVALLLPLAAGAYAIRAFWPPPSVTAPTTPSAPSAPPAPEDRTPEIRGRILDAEGNPVEGAAVRLVAPAPPYAVSGDTLSDALGTFSFAHVGPEVVRVVADHERAGFVSSAELHVGQGQSEEVTLVLSATSGVRGTVVDGENQPVAEATLTAEGVPWRVPIATSDATGAFHLIVVPDQATSLLAMARGYKSEHVTLGHRDGRGELVVRVHLSAAPPVTGDVADDEGKAIVAEVVACAGQPAEAVVTSEEDGSFELPPSAIGCEAVAHRVGYGSSDAAVVADGQRVQLRLKAGGAIEGAVVDERGSGVGSFTLGIESHAQARGGELDRGPRTFEDARGAFHWDKLGPGSYVLTASVPGRPPARSESIEVRSGVVTRGVKIVVAQGGAVVGHVYDEHRAPLAGVEVAFDSVSTIVDSNATARTDEAGRYRLEGAPSGPFSLRAQKPDFRMRMITGLRVAAGSTLTQDITLGAVDGGPGFEFTGIGANLSMTPEGIVVAAVGGSDPAGRAGLLAGDRIVTIDGESTDGMSVADAVQRLRGQTGTNVGVSVERPRTGQVLNVIIVRGPIVR